MSKFKNAMVAAIIAVSAIGCSELAEDVTAYDSSTNRVPTSPTAPADPAPDTDTDTDTDTGTVSGTVVPEVITDDCDAFGLVYDEANNTCVDGELDINIINPPVDEGEVFNFTVTPGPYTLIASWDDNSSVNSFRLERTKEGSPYINTNYPSSTSWTYATFYCTAHSFKLVATMTDGSVVESNATEYLKPSNCN